MKGERVTKMSSLGSIVRKRLSDITNSVPQPPQKSPLQFENLPFMESSSKDYIDGLLKENKALIQALGDKNKVIELSGFELKKLRSSVQKMQLQNWNLAQSNSRMLAELNLGKEKLKSLQHELICKDALLKAKNVELEEYRKKNAQLNVSRQDEECAKHKPITENNTCNYSRRRPLRSRSMGPSILSQQGAEKDTEGNKRRCLRRQSASSKKSCQEEPKENLFELEDINYSVNSSLEHPLHENNKTSMGSLCIKKEKEEENCVLRDGVDLTESKRTSLGRPLRKAAVKIHSYKEVPLNIKMRRSE